MIKIASKREGFRRCGIAHSVTPTEYSDDAFTPAQRALLEAEPMLIVTITHQVKPKTKQAE